MLRCVIFLSLASLLVASPVPEPQAGSASANAGGNDDKNGLRADKIGSFRNRIHGIKGDVYITDAKTLFIKVCFVAKGDDRDIDLQI